MFTALAMTFVACGNQGGNGAESKNDKKAETKYQIYTNDKYGFTVEVPSNMTQRGEAMGEEGTVFSLESKKDEIRELGFNDGVKFGYSDGGDALRSYVQMGQTMENGLNHIQHVVAKVAYKEDYGDDISEELLGEYCEQFIEGYKSIVLKK